MPTLLDIFIKYVHELLAVWSRVLVPKSNDVTKFMHDDAKLIAIFANRYCLWTIPSFANE